MGVLLTTMEHRMLYLGDIKSPTYRQVSPSSAGTPPFVSSLFTLRPGAFLRPITLIISYLFQHVCKIRHLLPRPRCLLQRRPQRTYVPPAFDQFHPLISITATSLEARHHGHGHHGGHTAANLEVRHHGHGHHGGHTAANLEVRHHGHGHHGGHSSRGLGEGMNAPHSLSTTSPAHVNCSYRPRGPPPWPRTPRWSQLKGTR